MTNITQSGLHCNGCGDDIYSNSRHDFVQCSCSGIFVDGGFDYMRWGKDANTPQPTPISRNLEKRPPAFYRQEKP